MDTLRRIAMWFRNLPATLRRHRRLLIVYFISELLSYWRFRMRMARLKMPRIGYRRGTLQDLQWLLKAMQKPVRPLKMNKESLQKYLDGAQNSEKVALSWEHMYVMVQESFCIFGPSEEEHDLLMQIASAFAKTQKLALPPAKASPPTCKAPVGFGSGELQVMHKPLPIEVALFIVRAMFDLAFKVLGYQGGWMPTPEGWIRHWLHIPRNCDPALLPTIFIHGVGMGACPYIPFLQRLCRGRCAPLLVIELPNCSRCSFQPAMPTPQSFRDALERILRDVLGISAPAKYVLIGHSLGTDYCSIVLNDPRLTHRDSILRPARLVLLDPICFAHESAESHRLPFWTVREALSQCGARWWRMPIQLLILYFVIRDEYNQEATKRAMVPGTDCMFRCPSSLLKQCPILVCLSGNDQAVPAWKVNDYLREQFPEIEVRMDPGLEHGGFLLPFLPTWLVSSHAKEILSFISPKAATVPRVTSLPGGDATEGVLLSRRSSSELFLK